MSIEVIKMILDVIVLVILPVTGVLALRVLSGIDKNNKDIAENLGKLWESHGTLSKDFYQMKGEHHVNHERRSAERMTWPGEK